MYEIYKNEMHPKYSGFEYMKTWKGNQKLDKYSQNHGLCGAQEKELE